MRSKAFPRLCCVAAFIGFAAVVASTGNQQAPDATARMATSGYNDAANGSSTTGSAKGEANITAILELVMKAFRDELALSGASNAALYAESIESLNASIQTSLASLPTHAAIASWNASIVSMNSSLQETMQSGFSKLHNVLDRMGKNSNMCTCSSVIIYNEYIAGSFFGSRQEEVTLSEQSTPILHFLKPAVSTSTIEGIVMGDGSCSSLPS
jgi:hypothetical protein